MGRQRACLVEYGSLSRQPARTRSPSLRARRRHSRWRAWRPGNSTATGWIPSICCWGYRGTQRAARRGYFRIWAWATRTSGAGSRRQALQKSRSGPRAGPTRRSVASPRAVPTRDRVVFGARSVDPREGFVYAVSLRKTGSAQRFLSRAMDLTLMPGPLEWHPAAQDHVRVRRGLTRPDDKLRVGGHALELGVGDEAEVRQEVAQDPYHLRVLPRLFGGGGALDDELLEQAGEHGLEGGHAQAEREVRDGRARRDGQAGVAHDDEVRVAEPG